MKILFVSSECAPFSKSGGLADVAFSLPPALQKTGDDMAIVTPMYRVTQENCGDQFELVKTCSVTLGQRSLACSLYRGALNGVPVYAIGNEHLFHRPRLYGYGDDSLRFAFFCRAVIDLLPEFGALPDILHCNDWETALAILYLKNDAVLRPELSRIKTVYTIHNIAKSVVVEGRPFVLELISRSDVGIWFDSHGKKILLEKYGRDFYTDALTGAYCRQYFEDQRASLQGMDGVAMIDVDHFKEINDAYGHPVGDVALKKIVDAILSCIRSTDMLIRYGGDEFLIIFPQIQKDAFTLKMRYIQDAVSRLAVDGYPDIRLSVSIGGVHRVEPLTEAIRQADQLMYRDKANKGVLRL